MELSGNSTEFSVASATRIPTAGIASEKDAAAAAEAVTTKLNHMNNLTPVRELFTEIIEPH